MSKLHHICSAAILAAFFTIGTALASVPITLPVTITNALGTQLSNIGDTGGTTTGAAFTGSCGGLPGLTIQDASSADGSSDAYDNAWQLWIDGAVFSSGVNAIQDITGRKITAGPVTLSGLNVTHQIYLSDTLEVARILASFHNPTGSPINTMVEVPVNFGSDGSTTVEGTSSGDAVFDVNDRWAVTSDGAPASDPVNTTVLYGPGAPGVVPTSVTQTLFSCAGTEGIGATFDFTIPAGGTSSLLFFAGLGSIDNSATNDIGTALVQAAAIWDAEQSLIDAGLLDDLTQAQLNQIRNWAFAPRGPGPDGDPLCGNLIPVGGPHAGWGLAIVSLMLLGIWLVRRRV